MTDAPAPDWRADFASTEEELLLAMASATPSQRLAWLEQALAFAHRVGALPVGEEEGDATTTNESP